VLKEIAVERPGEKAPEAIFMVRFHLKNMSPRANAIFLNLPVPFIAGLPGFCTKVWMFNEATGDFLGGARRMQNMPARSARFMGDDPARTRITIVDRRPERSGPGCCSQ
jgi:hypothetical protein